MILRPSLSHTDSKCFAKLFIIIVVGVIVVVNVRALWMANELPAEFNQLNKTTLDFNYGYDDAGRVDDYDDAARVDDYDDAARVDDYDDGRRKMDDDFNLVDEGNNSDLVLEEERRFQSPRSINEHNSEGSEVDSSEESEGIGNSQPGERDRLKCLILINLLKNEPVHADIIPSLVHVKFLEYSATTAENACNQYLLRVKILHYIPSNEDPTIGYISIMFLSPNLNIKEARLCSMPIKFLAIDDNRIQAIIQAQYLPPMPTNKEHINDYSYINTSPSDAATLEHNQGRNTVKFSSSDAAPPETIQYRSTFFPSESATLQPIQGSSFVTFLPSYGTTMGPIQGHNTLQYLPSESPTVEVVQGSSLVKFSPSDATTVEPIQGSSFVKFSPSDATTVEPIQGSSFVKFLPSDATTVEPIQGSSFVKFLPSDATTVEPIQGSSFVKFLPSDATSVEPNQGSSFVKFLPSDATTVEAIQGSSFVMFLPSDATSVTPEQDDINFDEWPSLNEHITWDSMRESTVSYESGQRNSDIPTMSQLSQQGGPGRGDIPAIPQLSQQGGLGNGDIPAMPQLSQQGGLGNGDIPAIPQLSQQGGLGNGDIPAIPQLSQQGGLGNGDIPAMPQLNQRRCEGQAMKECLLSLITDLVFATNNTTVTDEMLSSNCHQTVYNVKGGNTHESVTVYYCTVDRNRHPSVMGVVCELFCCYILEFTLLAIYLAAFSTDYSNASVWRIMWELVGFWYIDVLVLLIYLWIEHC